MRQEEFNQLLASHKDRIYSHALYSLRDAHDAEDVTQETFLKLWRHYESVSSDRVAGWLTRVAHNLCIDVGRRRQARTRCLGYADTAAVESLATERDSAFDPERGLILSERQQALLDAMATLTPETRSIMIMHYFQEMQLQEIGAALGKTVSALKVQIHRARKSLRLVLTCTATEPAIARRETG